MTTDRSVARSPAVVAHKVLNNNVVISVDSAGQERVLMGRGLGFQLQPTDTIDPAKVEKTFILEQGSGADHARQLLASVPYPVIEAVTTAVDEAERILGRSLGRRLPMAIIDHVQYVLERMQKGIRIPSTAMPELRVLHPQEFDAALAMARSVSASLQTDLPAEEAVFLTMHILNATRDEPNGTAALLFRRVQHVVTTVEGGLGVQLDVASPDYARFILHIQFLLQRLVAKTMLRGSDTSFFEFAKHSYPRSYAIAADVKLYVSEATGSELTDEELLYVIVHVERLANQVVDGAAP
ncbi:MULTISPECIES: PRD domain-containing protein [unclassified Cryobacterium]|uniref:PRD domain-containing protein n=1 Tax=unclassified Cryobacterium TaxID=2649013 RepID=UPI00106BE5AE|nr:MULTISPECIES: PRD domain-containing protein [unclassified Cryobacterium]TFC50582.1 PRD domain-containing protein [Cryobacterium sp. TMB3-1-2]TFC74196.1 PRD domain-containing protein [Cryobacterium sp. TMB3-10]TFC74800.1 PRD domain-containing protein [Cryobacterium sp. TMB3-15]TFC88290.1 PRD domain-containing protein [Cryobacterium sp. TMT4-31]TFD41042.1 PRD domain-containing protein [Cryobacterium sp. TMB3-12]